MTSSTAKFMEAGAHPYEELLMDKEGQPPSAPPPYYPPEVAAVSALQPQQPQQLQQQPATPQVCNVQVQQNAASPAIFMNNLSVGRGNCHMVCVHCSQQVMTKVTKSQRCKAHWCCCLLLFLGCPCLSCIPYCMDSYKKYKHTCPNCGGKLGTYNE